MRLKSLWELNKTKNKPIISNMSDFKKPLNLNEQIEYLSLNKRVVFNKISKEEAKEFLLRYNYINVITPFKFKFFKKDKDYRPIYNDGNNHIYEFDTDFEEYVKLYKAERSDYKKVFENISYFETQFNAIVSYYVLNHYQISSTGAFDTLISDLKNNAKANLVNKQKTLNHVLPVFDSFKEKLDEFASPYITFDRFTLNDISQIFKYLNNNLRQQIFSELSKYNLNFNYNNCSLFDDFLTRLVKIRNYVYHNSSVTILFRYYNVSTKDLRTSSDERRFRTTYKKILNFQIK